MAKTTLLDIVQFVLSDADGDEVNSVSDTVESMQAAEIVQHEYFTIIDEFDIKMGETLIQLDATSAATPVLMTRPEGFHSISEIQYNVKDTAGGDAKYQPLTYVDWDRMMDISNGLAASATNVGTLNLPDSGHPFLFRNDKAPQYWTILEGYDTIVFDSYDVTVESNLQNSKSLARGVKRSTFTIADGTVPDLPENLMVLLKNRARAMYFDLFKDGMTPGVSRAQSHSEVRSQRKKYVTRKLQQQRTGPNYGRKA